MENQNFFELLEDLKKQINDHRNEVEQRDKIISEFKDVASLLNDVRNYINDLKKQYSVLPTEQLKSELNDYMSEERDYLALMNEYASKINEFNHSKNYEKENEFLQLALEFQDVSDRLKELEKLSKKFGSKKTIGTNRVETLNAEGRKQYIHENYLAEYIELTEKKRKMLPTYKRMYDEFMLTHSKQQVSDQSKELEESVDYYNDERIGIAPSYVPSEEEYNMMSNQDKINLEKKYYEDMSVDEKISYCRNVLNTILSAKNTGKKELIKIDGQSYYVPVKMKGMFYEYHRKLKFLTDEKAMEQSSQNISNSDLNVVSDDKPSSLAVVSNESSLAIPSVEGEYVGNYVTNGQMFTPDYYDIYSSDLSNQTNYGKEYVKGDVLNLPEKIDDDEEVVFAEQRHKVDNDNQQKKEKSKNKVLKILKSRKPKNLKGLIKKLVAASLAVIAAITTFVAAHSFAKNGDDSQDIDSSSIEHITDEDIKYPTEDDIVDSTINNSDDVVTSDNKKNDDSIVNKSSDSSDDEVNFASVESSPIKIGDKVCISKDIIYSDVYSAMNNVDGLPAYHDNDMIREVYGIFLSNGDNYRYVVNNQEKVDELVTQGWKVKSVVIKNEAGLEGAEPIENIVKVQENEIGGMSR